MKKDGLDDEISEKLCNLILELAEPLMHDRFGFGNLAMALVKVHLMTALRIKFQINQNAADTWIEAMIKSLTESWKHARNYEMNEDEK